MSCAVSIRCSYTCIFMYILCDYFIILKNGCFACEVYWLIHLYVYKHAARLYQPCRNHCLFTTLRPPCYNQKPASGREVWTIFWQDCHNLVTTMRQPCSNLATIARLLQGCYKLATMLSIHGIKMAVLPCDKVVTT